jgi:hypothetical protein
MLQIDNHTPFSAALSVFPDAAGVETAYAVVKATFAFGAEGPVLAKQQLPLLATDVFWGDTGASSLRAAGEFALLKPATDVLLSGRAVAPTADTRVAEVSLAVGPVRRRLRIFGERHWQRAGGGWKPSLPELWQRVPLRWELAFGGFLPAQGDAPAEVELRNPVGRGLVAAKGEPQPGQPLPQIEDPEQLIQDPHDRPTPAGLGPVPPTWLPRRTYAGTYDEAWQRSRAPYLPLDFDARFFQVAPPPLVAPGFLQGGEPVHLQGFSAGGPITFTLPRCELLLAFDFDGAHLERTPQLETVLLEPDAGRLQMLFRAALAVDKKLLRLGHVQVHSRAFDRDGRPHAPLARLGRLPAGYETPA